MSTAIVTSQYGYVDGGEEGPPGASNAFLNLTACAARTTLDAASGEFKEETMPKVQPENLTVYKPGRGLQWVLSITFLLLLLFLVNSIAGSIWLASHKLWTDASIFALMFLLGGVLLLLTGIFLFAASHTEVRLGPDRFTMVSPNWRGPTPLFPYREMEIAYGDIAAVETRGEVYRYMSLPVIACACCLTRKDGKRFTMGYMRENPTDPAIPFQEIAAEIARRAGVSLVNKGVVDAGGQFRAIVQDEPPWDAACLAQERIDALRSKEGLAWKAAATLLLMLVAAGVLFQIVRLYGGVA